MCSAYTGLLHAGSMSVALSCRRAVPKQACSAQEAKANPYEDFERVFSMFASAEEVTGQAPAEGDAEPEEAGPEEAAQEEVKVSLCAAALPL